MKIRVLASFVTICTLSACGGSDSNNDTETPEVINVENVQQLLETNAEIAFAAYSDAVDTAIDLQTAIAAFEANPTEQTFLNAKTAWLVAREPYGQTEVYRFRLSPIDSINYEDENGPEGDINAWPLGEALIDYTVAGNDFGDDQTGVSEFSIDVDYPNENIINSDVEINEALISNTATAEDEHDVISGYHAIEFMLWGQDLNTDNSADTLEARDQLVPPASGGQRPLTDFTSDQYAARRFQFLEVVAAKLVSDLEDVRDGWAQGASYRTAFTSITTENQAKQKLSEILTGMGTLSEGELAGERMQIAFSSGSQEDEHSCFSDNTHRDIWLNAEGVSNSYYGVYAGYDSDLDGVDDETTRAVDGYGFDDYIEDLGIASLNTLASNLETALTQTEDNYQRIDSDARAGMPVDVQIETAQRSSGTPMYDTIISLNAQSSIIAQLATALEISDQVVDDEASGCDTTQPDNEC